MLAERLVQRLGIHLARAEPPRLDRHPAVGFLLLVPLQDQVAVLPRVEVPQLREPLLHLLEEVQDRVAVVGQLHLGIEVDVDVKVVRVANISIHPRGPEMIATTPAPGTTAEEPVESRPGPPSWIVSSKKSILP